jgi:hypothetical protein
MKSVIIFLFIVLNSCQMSAQENKNDIGNIFKNIKPKSLVCSISFNVRIRDDKGEVIGIKNIMNISNLELKDRIDNYPNKEELTNYLVAELQNGKFDWDANIILYYLKQEECINMFPYQPNKIKEWEEREKNNNIIFWTKK